MRADVKVERMDMMEEKRAREENMVQRGSKLDALFWWGDGDWSQGFRANKGNIYIYIYQMEITAMCFCEPPTNSAKSGLARHAWGVAQAQGIHQGLFGWRLGEVAWQKVLPENCLEIR